MTRPKISARAASSMPRIEVDEAFDDADLWNLFRIYRRDENLRVMIPMELELHDFTDEDVSETFDIRDRSDWRKFLEDMGDV